MEVGRGLDLTLPCMTIKMASNPDLGLDLWSYAATILRYSSSSTFPLYYYHRHLSTAGLYNAMMLKQTPDQFISDDYTFLCWWRSFGDMRKRR